MRDKSDARDKSVRDNGGQRGAKGLLSLLTLVTLLSVIVSASAQGLTRPRTLGSRLQRPTATPTRPSASASASASTSSSPSTSPSTSSSDEVPALNWDAAPVDIVLQAYGERVKKTILKDPQVPAATITLKSQPGQKLSEEEYLEAIETVLEMNQIHLEPYGESFIRALPRKDVRKEGIPLIMDSEAQLKESGRVVSMMIQFKNIGTEEAQKALEGLKSNSGILLVFERTNSILVTDTEQNINRMLEIAKMIDVASPVTEVVEYIQIKYASAQEVKTVIDNIVQESMKEQEKNGKQPQNQPQPTTPMRPLLGGLRRPGQQPPQNNTPVNQASLVMTVSDADRGMIRGKVVTIADERSNKILLITNAANMKFFKEVIAALDVETTPDTVVKVYRLKYAEAEDVSDMINDLIGNSSSSKSSGRSNQNQAAKTGTSGSVTRGNTTAAKKPANQRSGETKAGELNKDNTTVLADKRINGIVVMTDKELVPTIEQIIESMDIKLSQVLIETVIIEVQLGDELESGMDWVQKGRKRGDPVQAKTANGDPLFYTKRTTTTENYSLNPDSGVWTLVDKKTSPSILANPVSSGYSFTSSPQTEYSPDGLMKTVTSFTDAATDAASGLFPKVGSISRGGIMDMTQSSARYGLAGGAGKGATALSAVSDPSKNLAGSLNFIFDSDTLGLSAILQATKTDSRAKYVASPIVMTLDNKEAVVNATKMSYILKGFTSSGNSYSTIATPDYEQKELGIELKITPKINPNGTVMLTVEEKYTQLGANQSIKYVASNKAGTNKSDGDIIPTNNSDEEGVGSLQDVPVPTTITREMSADVLLENNQTVVFGGLTETSVSDAETGIPILKDIPLIGKWLFSKVEQRESRTELLVFMTPYVLDDAQAAQAEAIRRKKTMSDPRPWEDHGWSLSPLADPVAKKEQMRRIKDEWRKQDEERQTKIAIEKMKVERVKKLQAMSKEERDLWLKMHKEELDEEKQDELEEKMLDKESQEELKKLAAEIKAKKLGTAEKAIKEAEKEAAAENERGKLDAEKKAKAEAKGNEVKSDARDERGASGEGQREAVRGQEAHDSRDSLDALVKQR